MQYSQQSNAPEWFKSDDSKIYHSATSGTSPSNEWYEFDDRDDALDLINKAFHSQSFIDRFTEWNGEYYYTDEIIWDGDSPRNLVCCNKADLADMIQAESPF